METMVREVKKNKKQPVKGKVTKESDNNYYTYIQMVEKKAYDLYQKRGYRHGRDLDDWFEAEKLVGKQVS